MKYKFFAFGSFAANQVHYPKIAGLITDKKAAFVKGEIYRLRCGYPALIPDPQGELIAGELCELEVPESYVSILDQLMHFDISHPEKSLFKRQSLTVQVGNFGQCEAETYCLNPKKKTNAHKKITGGDWQQDLVENPPITRNLLGRQKDYIHRLAQTKGRDIVPIKLDLYRELMNLELIVDKGRRLALTPMGKEAAHFMDL